MGKCPVLMGTNVPNIYRTQSNIYVEQVKSINDPNEGWCYRSQTISERGMESDVIIITTSNLHVEFIFNIYRSLVLLTVSNYSPSQIPP
jgi:hypothetical protein